MSGAAVKAQQQAANECVEMTLDESEFPVLMQIVREADAALAPCVVLTREEATFLHNIISWGASGPPKRRYTDEALALLTPEERDADA